MRLTQLAVAFALLASTVSRPTPAQSYRVNVATVDPHSTDEWQLVAPHLPDPLHATPEKLETAGDVLRARRFPSDAVRFYKAAVESGGDPGRLLKKEGVVHLELQHGQLARLCFQQAVKLSKRDSEAWNDLGASDFMLGNTAAAEGEYKHAIKLNRESAIFRSNLALVYFELHEPRKARQQLARAVALDPEILHHSGRGGFNLQVLGSAHYAEICFEMARVYAQQGDRAAALEWLIKSAERGFDVRAAIGNDTVLTPYLEDDRLRAALVGAEGDQHAATSVPARSVNSQIMGAR